MKKKWLMGLIALIILVVSLYSALADECGSTPTNGCFISQNTTFNTGTHYITMYGITINADNVVLDCDGAILDGNQSITDLDESYNMLNVQGDNVTIKNCVIQNAYGLKADPQTGVLDNLVLDGNTFINSTVDYLESNYVKDVVIKNNNFNMESHFEGGGGDDWSIIITSQGENTLYNNTFNANQIGIGGCSYGLCGDGNLYKYHIYNNTFTHTHGGYSRDVLTFMYMNNSNVTGNTITVVRAILGAEDYSGNDMRVHNTYFYNNIFTWNGSESINPTGITSANTETPWWSFPDDYGNDGTNNVTYCVDGLGNDFQTGAYYDGNDNLLGTCPCGRGGNYYSGCKMLAVDTGHPESSFGYNVVWNDSITLEGFTIGEGISLTCSNSTAGFSGRGRWSGLPAMEKNTTLRNCHFNNYGHAPHSLLSVYGDYNIIDNNTINLSDDVEFDDFYPNNLWTIWHGDIYDEINFTNNKFNQINNIFGDIVFEGEPTNINILNNSFISIYINPSAENITVGENTNCKKLVFGSWGGNAIRNIHIYNNTILNATDFFGHGIQLYNPIGVLVENNRIYSTGDVIATYVVDADGGSRDIEFRNNIWSGSTEREVMISGAGVGAINNISFHNNTVEAFALYGSGHTNYSVYNNTINNFLLLASSSVDICNGGIGNTYNNIIDIDDGSQLSYTFDQNCNLTVPNGIRIYDDTGSYDNSVNIDFNGITLSGTGAVGINVTGLNSTSRIINSVIENVNIQGYEKSLLFETYTNNLTLKNSVVDADVETNVLSSIYNNSLQNLYIKSPDVDLCDAGVSNTYNGKIDFSANHSFETACSSLTIPDGIFISSNAVTLDGNDVKITGSANYGINVSTNNVNIKEFNITGYTTPLLFGSGTSGGVFEESESNISNKPEDLGSNLFKNLDPYFIFRTLTVPNATQVGLAKTVSATLSVHNDITVTSVKINVTDPNSAKSQLDMTEITKGNYQLSFSPNLDGVFTIGQMIAYGSGSSWEATTPTTSTMSVILPGGSSSPSEEEEEVPPPSGGGDGDGLGFIIPVENADFDIVGVNFFNKATKQLAISPSDEREFCLEIINKADVTQTIRLSCELPDQPVRPDACNWFVFQEDSIVVQPSDEARKKFCMDITTPADINLNDAFVVMITGKSTLGSVAQHPVTMIVTDTSQFVSLLTGRIVGDTLTQATYEFIRDNITENIRELPFKIPNILFPLILINHLLLFALMQQLFGKRKPKIRPITHIVVQIAYLLVFTLTSIFFPIVMVSLFIILGLSNILVLIFG